MATFTKRVLASVDDGYYAAGWFNNTSTFRFGRSFAGTAVIGAVRFNNVSIPQGATITSASIQLRAENTDSDVVESRIYGLNEDDTADFSSDPTGRPTTTATVEWNFSSGTTVNTDYTSPGIASVVQEIVNRAGWASGNDMGFLINGDDGSANDKILDFKAYDGDTTNCALLTVVYVGASPSASLSPSASASGSASASASKSASLSESPSPSPALPFFGLKIAKPGINVLETGNPTDLIFSSDYGTLKYFTKQTTSFTIDANNGQIGGSATYTHNLGYYPYVEVLVSVYIGAATGIYELCPFAGAGATVLYDATYKITTSQIVLYGQIDGVSSSVWNYDFIIFVYKNDLNLS